MTLTVDLGGAVVLVTGASSGLGRHFSRVLAAQGAVVVAAARRREALDEVVAEIVAAGGRAMAVTMDVTDEAEVDAALTAAERALGTPSIIVNNAGIPGPSRRMVEVDAASFGEVLDVDLTGAFRVARRGAAALIAARKGGSVINVASILGLRVTIGVAAYEAAKAGLIQLTRAMALEWARHGIRVNALAPGYIETDINRAFFETEAGRRVVGRIPQGRLGQPSDLDGPLLLLASDASRYMTGAVLAVDGGHLVSAL